MSFDITDEGMETLRLKDDEGKVIFEKTFDLWDVNNHIYDLQQKFKNRPAHEYHAAVVEYLKTLGFPPVSHRFADALIGRITARVQELKNDPAGESLPNSPDSTESTPSA